MRFRTLTIVAVLTICLCGAAAAQQTVCSPQTLIGTWVYNASGWAIPNGTSTAVPVTFLGAISISYGAKAIVSGPGTFIAGGAFPGTPIQAGTILEYTLDGTMEVTADCTGMLIYTMQVAGLPMPIGPLIERVVVVPSKGEILLMSVFSPLSKPLWTYTAKRISPLPTPVAWPVNPAPQAPN